MFTKKIIHVGQKATKMVGLMAYFGTMVFTFSYTAVLLKMNVITAQLVSCVIRNLVGLPE